MFLFFFANETMFAILGSLTYGHWVYLASPRFRQESDKKLHNQCCRLN